MARWAINGRFLTRRVTGVDRYAREIVRELDNIVEDNEVVVVVPEGAELVDSLPLRAMRVVRYGRHSGHVWEQLDFSHYLKAERLLGVNLCNTAPVRNPGVVVIHDMNVRANPEFYSKKFRTAYTVLFSLLSMRAQLIFTDSKFSAREIAYYYPAARGKVSVVPCAWQHIERVEADLAYTESIGAVPGSYYFAMSSLAPNKNLKWIVETALLNPAELFLVAGGINERVFGQVDIPYAPNVVYLGYVTDGQAKAFMQGCKGFLFPTFYEGFGIPPLEALACGAPVAVSDTTVMHEIYGDVASYLNPYIPCANVRTLFTDGAKDAGKILARYNWSKSSKDLLKLLNAKAETI